MNLKSLALVSSVSTSLAVSVSVGVTPARADVMVSAISGTMCLDLNQSTNKVTLYTCHGGANQNFYSAGSYGQIRFNGKCLDAGGDGSDMVFDACRAVVTGPNRPSSQLWALSPAGEWKNEGGWCADIPFQIAYSGARVQMHRCNGGKNQMWFVGPFRRATGAAATAAPGTVLNSAGKIIGTSGGAIVAQGGGNIVAQGGGNIVSQGGGNIVAQGGGNIVAQGGGN